MYEEQVGKDSTPAPPPVTFPQRHELAKNRFNTQDFNLGVCNDLETRMLLATKKERLVWMAQTLTYK